MFGKPSVQTSANVAGTLGPNSVIGDCQLIRELGRGGMGVVHLARHVRLGDLRAVKILPAEYVSANAIKRFKREAQTAASIKHPNVIKVHDVDHADGIHYIVMEYVDGKTFEQIVRARQELLPWKVAFNWTRDLLDALESMHQRKLIHRDIKPSNVMVSSVGSSVAQKQHVVLMDFGLVHDENDQGLTQHGMLMGTPAFMSPEQARGQAVDARSDLYSVGAMLYYLLTRATPFSGTSMEVLLQIATGTPPPSLSELRPDLPQTVRMLVERAMRPKADDRFASAKEMLLAIAKVLRTSAASPDAQVAPRPQSPAAMGPVAALQDTDRPESNTTPPESPVPPIQGLPAPELRPALEPMGDRLDAGYRKPNEREPVLLEAVRPELEAPPRSVSPGFRYGTGVVALVGVVVGGMMLFRGNGGPSTTASSANPDEVQRAAMESMVHIPAGRVHLGASEERLREFAATLDIVAGLADEQKQEFIDSFVALCQNEQESTVHLPAFWIDKHEVTNAEYLRFVEAKNYPPPSTWENRTPRAGTEDFPVTGVTYQDAQAYANWAHKKLPTIAQWTRAFRGDDERMYPWGNAWDASRANVAENKSEEYQDVCSVSRTLRDASQFGVLNLVGNVDEIMRDRPIHDGVISTVTKGSHSHALGSCYGVAVAQYPASETYSTDRTGFRCVVEEGANP